MGSAASSTSSSASLGGSFSGKKATIGPDGVLVDNLSVYKEFIEENEDNEEVVKVYLYSTEIKGFSLVSDVVYHELLYLEKSDGNFVIIEWTKSGLCITQDMNYVKSKDYKGKATIESIIKAAKRNSKNKFKLSSNNCRHWCERVLSDLKL